MTDDLDTLRPEVREAMSRIEAGFQCDDDHRTIRAELLRLATIEADALIALDCEHDWQVEHKRAEKAEAELVALKADHAVLQELCESTVRANLALGHVEE